MESPETSDSEINEDDYWDFYPNGSFVPNESNDKEDEPDQDADPEEAIQTVETRDISELIDTLHEIETVEATLHPDGTGFKTPGLLDYYANEISWVEPEPPFPSYEQMSPRGKSIWLIMSVVANNDDSYGTNVGEFVATFAELLDEFFPHCDGDPNQLEQDETKALLQLGIGSFLIGHSQSFGPRFEQARARFSQQ